MARRARRTRSRGFKAEVALAALNSEKTLARRVLRTCLAVAPAEPDAPSPIDLKALHAKIGELALENDFLSGGLSKARLLSAKR